MQHETLISFERLVGRAESPLNRELLSLMKKMVERIYDLEGQVENLESALNLDRTANVQAAFGIPESLAQILIMLSDGKPRSKEAIHAGLYYKRPESDVPEVKITDTNICKLRKYIEPHGIEILTVWGSGYKLSRGIEVVQTAIEQGSVAA